MASARTDRLEVPGASLHYRVRGDGPLLLIVPGGAGDADASDRLAAALEDGHTVLTYDRRGLSRSTVEDRSRAPGIATHAQDAALLLAALGEDPALVFGTSIGAVIALDLLAHHPDRVRHLVAYEPPLTELLEPDARQAATRAQREVEELFAREGVPAAMGRFAAMVGVDPADREDGVDPPRVAPEQLPNLEFFLTHDAPAVRAYHADLPALRAVADRLTLGAGSTSNSVVGPEHAARALAALLGRPVVEFRGSHTAPVLRPAAFAATLRTILDRAA